MQKDDQVKKQEDGYLQAKEASEETKYINTLIFQPP